MPRLRSRPAPCRARTCACRREGCRRISARRWEWRARPAHRELEVPGLGPRCSGAGPPSRRCSPPAPSGSSARGSTRCAAPERRISYFPVRSNLMALAVSTDDSAAQRLNSAAPGPEPQVPDAPVWLSIPTSVLKSGDSLPDGTRMFARGMERAETVTLAFTPDGQGLAARLDVRCRNQQDAADMASQLTRTTSLLRE